MKKSIIKFITSEKFLKILVVILAITAITYIEYLEFNRTVAQVENYMVQIIQEDNSFLALGLK